VEKWRERERARKRRRRRIMGGAERDGAEEDHGKEDERRIADSTREVVERGKGAFK
jgi:hypothetical protein